MSEPQTTLALAEVARRLDGAGITWAVFAGAAAAVYGATRPLTDVDILVPAAEGDRVADQFPEARVKRREDGSVRGVELPGFDIVAGLAWRVADATYTLDLDAQTAARLTRHEIAGVTVPVVPPEDNILLKAMWGRGPEVGKHDWEDVEAMMAYLPALDWEYLRWRAGVCGPQAVRAAGVGAVGGAAASGRCGVKASWARKLRQEAGVHCMGPPQVGGFEHSVPRNVLGWRLSSVDWVDLLRHRCS